MGFAWKPLGPFSEPQKALLNGWLVGPIQISRQVSAIWGAKRFPKGIPRRFKIESKKRLELKTRFLQKVLLFRRKKVSFFVSKSI